MGDRRRDLVLEAVTRERRVVHLDVDLDLALEAVLLQERQYVGDVVVVLVLGRLVGLRLDQDRALEADLVLVLDDELHEAAELVRLAGEIGVEQGLVALASAPEHVVGPAQPMCGLEAMLDLRRRPGEDGRVGVGRGPRRIARVPEQVCRAPQQPDAGPLHVPGDSLDHVIEAPAGLREVRSLRRDVTVVEAEERDAQLREELEGDLGLAFGELHDLAGVGPGGEPRTIERAIAEHVRARPTEAVPVADGEAQMLLHAPSLHDAVAVVVPKGQVVVGIGPFEADGFDLREVGFAHRGSLSSLFVSVRAAASKLSRRAV